MFCVAGNKLAPRVLLQLGNFKSHGLVHEIGFAGNDIDDAVRNHIQRIHLEHRTFTSVDALKGRARELFSILRPRISCELSRITDFELVGEEIRQIYPAIQPGFT